MEGIITTSVLMCHAPIVIPEIAKGQKKIIEQSTRAMAEVAQEIVRQDFNGIVLISPHAPRLEHEFAWLAGEVLKGDFADFGHPELMIEFPNFIELGHLLTKEPSKIGRRVGGQPLDHGSLVPLYFLNQAGYGGKVGVISLPYSGSRAMNMEFGLKLAEALGQLKGRFALVASGDMSHRLRPGAPAGYDPQAHVFDQAFIEMLRSQDYRRLDDVSADLRERAAEDVVDAFEVVTSATQYSARGARFLSYEAPFGVGYGVAILSQNQVV